MTTLAGNRQPSSAAQHEIWLAHHPDSSRALHDFGGYLELTGTLAAHRTRFASFLCAIVDADADVLVGDLSSSPRMGTP